MPIRNLNRIFNPQRIAVIGGSAKPGSVGSTILSNLLTGGYSGDAYCVNPKYQTIGDQPCFASVSDLPQPVDLAIICTPAPTVPELVRQCGENGILGVVIISAGFRETGPEGKALEAEIARIADAFEGMRIVGPNCLGFMAPHAKVNASFAGDTPPKGHVAFISQSGALCTSVLDWALDENIGFSYFVSVGNMLDVGVAELIDFFATDQYTESILLYVESISEAREFMSAARAFAKNKPIIAYKAGRFAQSAQAAASHTGAMAGVDAVYQAALARAGIVRVFEIDDLFDCAELLARQRTPKGAHLAIITNAGGPGVIAVDALLDRGGVLASLSDDTLKQLDQQLPSSWSHANPIDILGDATPDRFADSVRAVLADKQVDGVIVILSPQAMTDATATASAIVEAAKKTKKPVLAVWMGRRRVRDGIQVLNDANIPTYFTPEKAVRAFTYLVSYARNRETLYETPREIPMEFQLDRPKLRAVFDTILSEGHEVLSESTSKALLEAYEIPVAHTYVAHSADDAIQLARRVGYPVALKIFSPQITHKTDVGGVALNLAGDKHVHDAFERIVARAKKTCPEAQIDGVTVQRMIALPDGRELIVGAKRDPVFGTVLMAGAGGTAAELFRDRALELPPLSERLARRMLESLRFWPLLSGYRGHPAVDVDKLIEVLMRLSYLVADYPEIVELDVNPLLVSHAGVIALDARIVLDRQTILHPARPYSHLAIRPYPEDFVRRVKLKDGMSVLLRPIKPEDEPMWHELVTGCSPESLRMRFNFLFKGTTHEMATRFCFIDYDREMAIVAEIEDNQSRRMAGVVRLVADVDHQEAEYAVLVGDHWQGLGLGSVLTDYCLEICSRWGVRRVIAETAPINQRMLTIFEHRGFVLDRSESSDVVIARATLPPPVTTEDRLGQFP